MKKYVLLILTTLLYMRAFAQFDSQVGLGAKYAIQRDSSIIKNWAKSCTVTRGWQNYRDTTLGKATVGSEFYATEKADGTVISLGDSGIAVLQFNKPIANKEGPDFCVFENGFIPNSDPNSAFLELAFVEVSSDGINYFRFPCQSLIDTTVQLGNFDYTNAILIDGLASKYINGYGTPFDLSVFSHLSALNINRITHVRLIDVVGDKDATYPARDAFGRKIIDPWPTPFPTSGFDLDALGVINEAEGSGLNTLHNESVQIYPNPIKAGDKINIAHLNNAQVRLIDINGKELVSVTVNNTMELETQTLNKGIYFLVINEALTTYTKKLIVN